LEELSRKLKREQGENKKLEKSIMDLNMELQKLMKVAEVDESERGGV